MNFKLRGQLALVTGASSGIGLATAEALAEKGSDLILTGRRSDRLNALAERLRGDYGVEVTPLTFDISKRAQVEAAMERVKPQLLRLSILINSAGLALGTSRMAEADLGEWEAMVDTNVKGLLFMTRLCLTPMLARGELGHIVNIGSVAGRWTYPGGSVYCATKFAVRALTEGLRMDLLGQPIRVTNIEPGMVETEFSLVRLGDEAKAKKVYEGMTPLVAKDIADTITWCLERPAHVNIQELVIYPTQQAGVGAAYTFRG
jgi:3-hydroxy acid dehydrogenase/malonic semialdehyde reductase